jgi:hypothetical protein
VGAQIFLLNILLNKWKERLLKTKDFHTNLSVIYFVSYAFQGA